MISRQSIVDLSTDGLIIAYRKQTDSIYHLSKINYKRSIETCLLPQFLFENQSIIYRPPIEFLLQSIDYTSMMVFGTVIDDV